MIELNSFITDVVPWLQGKLRKQKTFQIISVEHCMFESNLNLNLNLCRKRCGSNLTLSQRWLEGSHPTEEGESAEAMAFFDFDNNPKYKSAPVSIHL